MKFISEDKKVNFIEGIITMGGAGGPVMKVSYVIFICLLGRPLYLGLLL